VTDLGPAILKTVHSTLQIDEPWTLRGERGFKWWAYRHGQRVWAEPMRASYGEYVTLVRAETDVLRDVPNNAATEAAIALANASSSMSALIHRPDEGRLAAHCSAYFHSGNRWLVKIFSSAAILQLVGVEARARELAETLGGELDTTVHPSEGTRWEPDEMLNAGGLFVQAGQKSSPFTDSDLAADGAGLAHFRLTVAPAHEHPVLGSGALLVLNSIASTGPEESARLANELNRREARTGIDAHFLGAWCGGVEGLSFRMFLPALLAGSEPVEGRHALLFNFSAALVRRAYWAGEQLHRAA
jgi:hypothetical protein